MTRMLTIIAALAASTLLGGWGFDRQGPYCLFDRDYTSCGYFSLQACNVTRSGAGGYCGPNPRFVSEEPPPRRRKYR